MHFRNFVITLASGLSYVQVDKHGITILYHLHQFRPCISFCAKFDKACINVYVDKTTCNL